MRIISFKFGINLKFYLSDLPILENGGTLEGTFFRQPDSIYKIHICDIVEPEGLEPPKGFKINYSQLSEDKEEYEIWIRKDITARLIEERYYPMRFGIACRCEMFYMNFDPIYEKT